MSIESVRAFFAEKAPDITVIESSMSSATVTLAAEAYGVEPARIAKTLSLRIGERVVLIVAAGTARMDNKKVKALFGGKPKMLGLEEVAEITGHEVGGVCPFGLKTPLPVYCDVSLKAFDVVVPAAGSTHSAVKITPQRMAELTNAEWVDVCQTAGRTRSRLNRLLDIGPRLQRLAAAPALALRPRGAVAAARLAAAARCACLLRICAFVSNTARQPFDSCGVFCRKQLTIRLTSGNLVAAQPPHIGRAGHLLFPGSAIFLRRRRACGGNRQRKREHDPLRSHAGSFLLLRSRRRAGLRAAAWSQPAK